MEPGERFERYTIEGILGMGGMGRVYRAHDPKLGRDVAIKVLLSGPSSDVDSAASTEARARILREARAAAALSHPNAVSIYDVGENEDTGPYIVMELVVGKSLREIITDRKIATAERLRILKDVGLALSAAHERGIVHRDVKPENVLVRADGAVKVLDFGIARRAAGAADPSAPTEAPLPTLTEHGAQLGTPLYMAPEQIKGDPVDGRTDQFSWGAVAYESFSGRPPWRIDKGALGVAASILTDKPAALSGVPSHVQAAIFRALSKDPADRFASMREAITALDTPTEDDDEPPARPPRTSRAPSSDPPVEVVSPSDAPFRPREVVDDPRRYDTTQFKAIFQRALERQEGEGRYAYDDLVAAAREMGIRDDVLEATLADDDLRAQRDRLAVLVEVERRRTTVRGFVRHAAAYLIVNVFLHYMMGGWSRWVLYGWGIGLAFHLLGVILPKNASERRAEAEQRQKKEAKREAKRQESRARREAKRQEELERRERRRGRHHGRTREQHEAEMHRQQQKLEKIAQVGQLIETTIEEGVKILLSNTAKRKRYRVDIPMPGGPSARDVEAEREADAEAEEQRRDRSKS